MQIPLSRPDITEKEIVLVNEVLRSTFLALGPKMVEFEEAVARYVGRKFAVAVNSGTSGLHLLIKAYGIGEGDEVITTPFSFIASSNCILYERARPVFVDIEPETGNIDPNLIEEAITPRTKAILPVDAFGQPARLDVIRDIARRHGLVVIEDACEALGSEYKGEKTGSGSFADAAVFAFYPNKQITTGEGGMIVTDDARVAGLCRSLRNQGRGEGGLWLNHERLGYNYRLDELSAALGLAQMGRIEEIITKRKQVAELYNQRLAQIPGIRLPYIAPEVTRMSWFVYVIRVGVDEPAPAKQAAVRDHVMRRLQAAGIGCRPYFTPIHLQPFYRSQFGYREGDFPVTEAFGRTSIAIPFHNNLTAAEVDYVASTLAEALI
ncbi:GDP-perosamine synthase [Moorella thermoacetica]|uniref:GDP-perosamine synthase n=1 Tax=Neomoorella thermoacetica TaxID=1525 RepID=A0AAC9MU87_NEOTH|nr:DegT/DnrJ/EryC1/StrS family aminotransferase [Moorella thermoacetica]AOQ23327.1 UDP-4-amino-4-deoxy-L-arabinose--oxoglutarate aminotransferase [Moorella thermoacetica]TYL13035.1 GDP-perosamine synthase [Moorella thermoacetica]